MARDLFFRYIDPRPFSLSPKGKVRDAWDTPMDIGPLTFPGAGRKPMSNQAGV